MYFIKCMFYILCSNDYLFVYPTIDSTLSNLKTYQLSLLTLNATDSVLKSCSYIWGENDNKHTCKSVKYVISCNPDSLKCTMEALFLNWSIPLRLTKSNGKSPPTIIKLCFQNEQLQQLPKNVKSCFTIIDMEMARLGKAEYLSSSRLLNNNCHFTTISSVETATGQKFNLTFNETQRGLSVKSNEFCLTEDGTHVSLNCMEDGTWSTTYEPCVYSYVNRNVSVSATRTLYDLSAAEVDIKLIEKEVLRITADTRLIKPVDINLLGNLFMEKNISAECCVTTLSNLIKPTDSVLMTLTSSQMRFNATDRLLDSFDIRLSKTMVSNLQEIIAGDGMIVVSLNVNYSNKTGLVLDKKLSVRDLYSDQTKNGLRVSELEPFLLVVYLTDKLVAQLRRSGKTHVIFTIFLQDILFIEEKIRNTTGHVISVLIPDFTEIMIAPIHVIYRKSIVEFNDECAYWNYGGDSKGTWREDQEQSTDNNVCSDYYHCQYWHITHFGLLILGDFEELRAHEKVLGAVTMVGGSLSLLGCLLIFFTAIVYRKWSTQPGTLILVHFSSAIVLQLLVLFTASVFKPGNNDCINCIALGSFLHYFVLTVFTWMLVLSYLNYRRYVIILVGPPPRFLVTKTALFAWLVPVAIVLPLVLTEGENYARNSQLGGLCYPTELAFYLGVLAPIIVILIVNGIVFGNIAWSIFKPQMNAIPRTQRNVGMLRSRLLLLLFFALGLTWTFGIFASFTRNVFMVYVFSMLASMQGFVVFWCFIVTNKSIREFYLSFFKKTVPYSKKNEDITVKSSLNTVHS